MKNRTSKANASALDFSPPLLRLQTAAPNPLGRKVLWALLLLLAGIAMWSFFGRLDIVAVAEGKLVPQSYVKIVQPAESGIVKEILVREGHSVSAGQVLMRMDALLTDADASSVQSDLQGKRLALRRIDAELANAPFERKAGDSAHLAPPRRRSTAPTAPPSRPRWPKNAATWPRRARTWPPRSRSNASSSTSCRITVNRKRPTKSW